MHPNSNLKIIVLNTIVADIINTYLWQNITDPWHELEWLNSELKIAELNKNDVIILGHTPPGCETSQRGIHLNHIVLNYIYI